MTRKKKETNLDLATAERMLIDAGSPELVAPLKFYTEGMRNEISKGISEPFVEAYEGILKRELGAIKDEIEHQGNIRRTQFNELRDYQDGRHDVVLGAIDHLEELVKDGSTRLGKLEDGQAAIVSRIEEVDQSAQERYEANAASIEELKVEQARQGAIIDARPAQRAAEKEERLAWQAAIERRVAELERGRSGQAGDGNG